MCCRCHSLGFESYLLPHCTSVNRMLSFDNNFSCFLDNHLYRRLTTPWNRKPWWKAWWFYLSCLYWVSHCCGCKIRKIRSLLSYGSSCLSCWNISQLCEIVFLNASSGSCWRWSRYLFSKLTTYALQLGTVQYLTSNLYAYVFGHGNHEISTGKSLCQLCVLNHVTFACLLGLTVHLGQSGYRLLINSGMVSIRLDAFAWWAMKQQKHHGGIQIY